MTDTVFSARAASWPERAAVTAIFLASGLGIGVWAVAIPAFKITLHLSDGALSLPLLGFAVGAILAMPMAGLLAGRIGTARVTRIWAVLFAASVLVPPFCTTLPALIAAAFALGASQGSLDVAMNATAGETERRWGHPIMSSFHAAWSAGGLAGAALGGAFGGSAQVMQPGAALALLLTVGAWKSLRDDAVPRPLGGPRLALPGRAALPLCAAALLCMLCEGAMVDWNAVYLRTVAGAPAGLAAAGFAAFSVAMVTGRLIGDGGVRRLGRVRVVRTGAMLAAAGLALAVAMPAPLPASAGFALVGLGLANIVPVLFSAAGRLGPSPAIGVAMTATSGYGGSLAGPALIGVVAEVAGLRASIALMIVVAGTVALLAGAVQQRKD